MLAYVSIFENGPHAAVSVAGFMLILSLTKTLRPGRAAHFGVWPMCMQAAIPKQMAPAFKGGFDASR